MSQLQIIHSRNGRIGPGTDSTPESLDNLMTELAADPRSHLVIHFHGGLVSKAAGLAGAQRLSSEYGSAALPLFYVWESGFFETLRNNLWELHEEPVFKQLARKLLEYALQRLGGQGNSRAILPGTVNPREVKSEIDTYWSHPDRTTIPFKDFEPVTAPAGARSASQQVDEAEIQADLESDAEFAAALATLPDIPPGARSAMAVGAVERRSPFNEAVADRVSEQPGTRGLFSWYKVAVLVKNVLIKVLRRYSSRRDHGLYATVVEEIVREISLGGSSVNEWGKALQWNRMKRDSEDAFGSNTLCAGSALLTRLAAAYQAGKGPRRLTLIGHSTGAIYIAYWLAAADRILPAGVTMDVIFLAPAITYELFDKTLTSHASRIANFRMFAMRDELERDDQVWGEDESLQDGRDWRRFIYPSSLLYLVSGVLESRTDAQGNLVDAPDMPLLGMERFFTRTDVYTPQDFPEVERVRAWLKKSPHRMVWARTSDQGDGLNCMCIDHGGFNEEAITLKSIVKVLGGW